MRFDVILLKSTAGILAAAMFVGDRTTASTSLAGAAAVVDLPHENLNPELICVADCKDVTNRCIVLTAAIGPILLDN